ncbi:hypothetical protein, partial [Winogradskyella poriferorum]|uniref:hypothetical protein n=1 Tax=Winogradskyella poriferorum TaxID=307627 RepID=UPI003D65908B
MKDIILATAGLYLEASAEEGSTTPGSTSKVNLEVLNRSNLPISLKKVELIGGNTSISPNSTLQNNEKQNLEITFEVPTN